MGLEQGSVAMDLSQRTGLLRPIGRFPQPTI
jgi:hypothetical protein